MNLFVRQCIALRIYGTQKKAHSLYYNNELIYLSLSPIFALNDISTSLGKGGGILWKWSTGRLIQKTRSSARGGKIQGSSETKEIRTPNKILVVPRIVYKVTRAVTWNFLATSSIMFKNFTWKDWPRNFYCCCVFLLSTCWTRNNIYYMQQCVWNADDPENELVYLLISNSRPQFS